MGWMELPVRFSPPSLHAECMAMPLAVRIKEQQGIRTEGWFHGSVPQAPRHPTPDSTLLSDNKEVSRVV